MFFFVILQNVWWNSDDCWRYVACTCLCYHVGVVVVHVGMLTPPTQQLRFVNQTYTVSVAEHSAHGTVLVTVLARTSNSTVPVVYSLADGDHIFDINHYSGLFCIAIFRKKYVHFCNTVSWNVWKELVQSCLGLTVLYSVLTLLGAH